MTDSTTPTPTPTPAPTGLKAKANELGLKLYLKSPPPVQNAMLQGFLKTQPVIAKVTPHAKQIVGGGLSVVVLRKVRNRRK
jgi:hypothetical protein